jgi:peptide/nickel transport system ATP-binding protein
VACHHWETADDGDAVGTASVDEPTVVGGEQSDDPVVSLRDLHVHFEADTGWLPNPFRRPDVVRAVDGVDLDVYENDVVALIGESGCGKTTLGKAAIAARRPTSGRVDYRGQDVWAARDGDGDVDIPFGEIRRSLQIVHQDPGSSLNPHRTVRSILRKPIEAGRAEVSPATRERRITELLRYVGMTPPEDYADRYPHQLSGGEQQRVALVRALLTNPDLILADEAVSALDVSLRVEMMDLMLDLQAEFDTSFLFVSHNLANARYFAGKAGGRIGVMYLGELVEIGPAEEVVADPKHPYTKALNWATTELDADDTIGDPPIEGIDVPDPVNPPTGCRFHTRCPEAREACTREAPSIDGGDDGPRGVACFRERGEDHPYWSSDPVEGRTRRDPPNS